MKPEQTKQQINWLNQAEKLKDVDASKVNGGAAPPGTSGSLSHSTSGQIDPPSAGSSSGSSSLQELLSRIQKYF